MNYDNIGLIVLYFSTHNNKLSYASVLYQSIQHFLQCWSLNNKLKTSLLKKSDVHNQCWTTSKVLTKKWTYAIKNAFVFYENK